MSNHYQTILFDLDSTLIDNVEAFRRILPIVSKRYPIFFNREDLLFRIYFNFSNGERIFEDICWEIHWDNPPTYAIFFDFLWDLYIHASVCFPCTVPTLEILKKRGYRLGIITNGDPLSQNVKIDAAGIRDYFDTILVSKAVGISKPNSEIYELAMEMLGAEKNTTLFVGDNPKTDIMGARNTGIDSFLVSRGKDLLGATYIGPDISEILKIL